MEKDSICLRDVSKSFRGETVLEKVNLTFQRGKIYGLMGRNGSGKTVLLKMICGFISPDTGTIEIEGKQIGKDRDFPEKTGVLIESPGFLPAQSGFKNLRYLAQIRGLITDEEIREAMTQVGLDWKNRKWVGRYSMGMRQRLGIAQAIMENQEIILLDEPMNGLDEQGTEDIRRILLALKEQGKTILLASHNKEDIEILCDQVFEVKGGRVSEKGLS